MGSSNLRKSLETKMGLWAGELKQEEAQIAQIESLFESLPTLIARADRLKQVLNCAGVVMSEIDPTWSEEKIKPSRPFAHKSPVRLGNTAKLTLDILRQALEPMTVGEIAGRVLELEGIPEPDPKDLKRVKNSIDATLRQKAGRVVQHDGGFVYRWSVIRPL